MATNLNSNLLFTDETLGLPSALNGTTARGLYSPMQFVLRLRDDIRHALNKETLDEEKIQASSTSMHENIHWWQHIGSNFGFLLNVSYPALSTASIPFIKDLMKKDITYKSFVEYDRIYYDRYNKSDIGELNYILNNYYDLYHAKLFAFDNKNINKIMNDRRFFLSIGHCYRIFWQLSVSHLMTNDGNTYKVLPKIEKWHDQFSSLEKNKIAGFYPDSPMSISPLGIRAIFEGQARFIQIQYLAAFFNFHYEDFKKQGLISGIYAEAFNLFLKITGLTSPSDMLSATVGLFLLVCDISINPNNGFPLDIYDYENFISKNDPGIRFVFFCKIISTDTDKYTQRINSYSKDEYIDICNDLCQKNQCISSYESIKKVIDWFADVDIQDLLHEEEKMKYEIPNLPIRLLFSKYLRFQEDKCMYPHIFCWLGYHSVQNNTTDVDLTTRLYHKHHAPYVEGDDGEIKAVTFSGYKSENIYTTFNNFYKYNVAYDLIYKWIGESGPFNYDYGWLCNTNKATLEPTIKEIFKEIFVISPDEIKITP